MFLRGSIGSKAMKKAEAIFRIQSQVSKVAELKKQERYSKAFEKWKRDTEIALAYIFGEDSRHVKEFLDIRYSLMIATTSTPDYAFDEAFIDGLDRAVAILNSMLDEIQEYWNEDAISSMKPSPPHGEMVGLPFGKDVFLIHGHDEGLKQTVARFLEKLGLNPIILHEQPNRGRTIIEKFEQHASVGFAVALFTADDLCSTGEGANASSKYRARQNVVFEFGFFMGKLGRDKVCALYEEGVELPSDYQGVLYIPLDKSERWKFDLLKELKFAGFDVDANLALS
ncbi:putative nucleotide-binding protein containing TIR-like domain protein [compost metagenome]